MRKLRAFVLRVVGSWRKRSLARDVDAELNSHIDLHIADFMRAGIPEPEARRRALVALGGVAQTRERYRERSRVQWTDDLMQDLKFATRVLIKDRGFALTVVVVLALGIGANAAIFSVVDALVLKPLPFFEPDRLVMIWEDASKVGFPENTPAPGNYFSWRERNRTLSDIAATRSASANLTVDGPPEFVMGRRATANFFKVLGVEPLLGRTFTEEEDRLWARVTVISYSLWQRRYGGDRDAVGSAIVMSGERHTIIGVMPRAFVFRNREMDFWTPMRLTPEQQAERSSHYLNVVGRLATGVSVDDADKDIRTIAEALKREYPQTNRIVGSRVESLRTDLLGDRRSRLMVLSAASICVLLIACANIAALLLLRALNRRGELAIRASLGATGGRIARQLVVEAMILAFAGSSVALVLAPIGAGLLADAVPMGMIPLSISILDPRLFAATAALAIITSLMFGLGPALHIARAPVIEGLQYAGRSKVGGAGFSRDVLVVCQLAAAVVLLVGTGLMLQTFMNLRRQDLGFRPEQLLTLRTTLPVQRYGEHSRRVSFYGRVLDHVRQLPQVVDAAYISTLPFTSIGNTTGYSLEGRPERTDDVLIRIGTVGYLKTIGATLVEGRFLDPRDRQNAPPVVVVNETFARVAYSKGSAVGRRIMLFGDEQYRTIVGVVDDVRERGYLPDAKPAVYPPNTQITGTAFLPETLIVRASGDLQSLVPSIRRAVASVDPEQPVSAIRTMQEVIDRDVVDYRQQAVLLAVFAALAVMLAASGLYGLLAYSVAQRKGEIAVRMAMGASTGSVMRTIVIHGQKLAWTGVAIGLVAAFGLSRALNTLLYGVTASDPITFGTAGAVLWVIAVLACVIPAFRAARVSPASLLRGD